MFKHFLAIFLTYAVLVVGCADCARAQEQASVPKYSRLGVVTAAQPTVLQHCKVVSMDNRQVVCRGLHHSKTTYLMSDVIALIDPALNEHFGLFALSFLAGSGALIYAAVIAGSALATAGWSVAAFIVLCAIGAMAVGDNSTSHDTLIYKKPGTTLSDSLHLKLGPYNEVVVTELPR